MKSVFKILPLAAMVVAAGCASNSQLDENQAMAQSAQSAASTASSDAASAQSAAARAQATADEALRIAKAAQAAADEANEKVDRAFKKAMQK